jgi:ferredoxin-NADP reductase/ferredoxin
MPVVCHEGQSVELAEGQSVLDALLAQGVPVPYACRAGICQSCLMRAVEGQPPASSQQGLKETLRLQNYFLACVCHPTENLRVALPSAQELNVPATVTGLRRLNAEIIELTLMAHAPLDYRAGQFIAVINKDTGQGRSYSLASVPGEEESLHLHVRRLPGGRISGWIHEELRAGQTIEIRGPAGDCFYVPGRPEQPLLLIGTGSGLAPLYGILRDALARGHWGPIRLFHGSRNAGGIYLRNELRELARRHPRFDYVPCLSGPDISPGYASGRAHDAALAEVPDLKGWRVFLCGHPDMVQQAQMRAYLAGASLQEIHADAFQSNHAGAAS